LCVCELVEPLGLAQPTVSHHLRKLLDAGLVERQQGGKWAYFSLQREAVEKLAAVADLKGAC
jgi:ArsR family transcriptional regulator